MRLPREGCRVNMKIAMLTEGLILPSSEGATWRFNQLLKILASQHEVTLIHPYRGWSDLGILNSREYRVVACHPDDFYGGALVFRNAVRRYGADAVICKDIETIATLISHKILANTSLLIYDCHDLIPTDNQQSSAQSLAFRVSDIVLSISSGEMAEIQKHPHAAGKAIYVPCTVGVGDIVTSPVYRSRADTLAFLGHYFYQPNADAAEFLIESVMPLVRQQIPTANLLMIGAYPTELAARHSQSYVRWLGRVESPVAALQLADVAFSVVLTGTGFRVKMLHYLAAGRPVVANALGVAGVGALPGVLIAETPRDLAAHAISLLRSSRLRSTHSRKALNGIRATFVDEVVQQKLNNELQRFLDKRVLESGTCRMSLESANSSDSGVSDDVRLIRNLSLSTPRWLDEVVQKGRFLSKFSPLVQPGEIWISNGSHARLNATDSGRVPQ